MSIPKVEQDQIDALPPEIQAVCRELANVLDGILMNNLAHAKNAPPALAFSALIGAISCTSHELARCGGEDVAETLLIIDSTQTQNPVQATPAQLRAIAQLRDKTRALLLLALSQALNLPPPMEERH